MRSTLPTVLRAGALALFGASAACQPDLTLPEPEGEVLIAFDGDLERWPLDAWALDTAFVAGDSLALTVSYGGGCESHEFWLLAVDGFHELPTAGPVPTASVALFLAHDDHDDRCEAYVTRTESFHLGPLWSAFQDRFPAGRLQLRIPTGQGSADSVTVEFTGS